MAVAVLPQTIVSFSGFELDLTCGELHKNGQKVALPPKSFEVLRALVERPGEVVTREELRTKLWSADTFVEFDDSLNHAVNTLRHVWATRPSIRNSLRPCRVTATASSRDRKGAGAGVLAGDSPAAAGSHGCHSFGRRLRRWPLRCFGFRWRMARPLRSELE